MTKREQQNREWMQGALERIGFSAAEFRQLRRISMTLSRWAERECGDGSDWAIERDSEDWVLCSVCGERSFVPDAFKGGVECHKCKRAHCFTKRHKATGKPYLVYHGEGKSRRIPIADREQGALRRMAKIMETHPACVAYHQPDCRGAAVYIIPKERVTGPVDSCYTNGIAVY